MVTICIPTLNAYDDLKRCIDSVNNSSIECNVAVIDNGGRFEYDGKYSIIRPLENLGVAGSWNWFIDNIPEHRIISNDDIIFDKYAIERILESYSDYAIICPENLESSFSCFLLPQNVIDVVGLFDEWISPRYAYFEDDDYSHRMSIANLGVIKARGSLVQHVGSSTIKHMNKIDANEHHDKFRLARSHYVKKWGGEPGQEIYTTPFGK